MASDTHASYAKIGLTVFVGIAAIVATLVYIGGMRGRGSEILVETYYDKPVSGLSVGSPVNFRGVKIGEIREISFVGSKYDEARGPDRLRIYILMAITWLRVGNRDGELVEAEESLRRSVDKLGLRASVTSSGITGMSRIECDFNIDENLSEPPQITWLPRHVYIPAKTSLMDNFSDAATKVMNQINKMDMGAAWSNFNVSVSSLSRMMNSVQSLVETRQGDVDRFIDDLSATSAAIRDLTAELRRNPSLLIRERRARPLSETE